MFAENPLLQVYTPTHDPIRLAGPLQNLNALQLMETFRARQLCAKDKGTMIEGYQLRSFSNGSFLVDNLLLGQKLFPKTKLDRKISDYLAQRELDMEVFALVLRYDARPTMDSVGLRSRGVGLVLDRASQNVDVYMTTNCTWLNASEHYRKHPEADFSSLNLYGQVDFAARKSELGLDYRAQYPLNGADRIVFKEDQDWIFSHNRGRAVARVIRA